MRKTIVLLVGPKAAGKTYLATRMEAELEASFLRVEQIWLELSRELSPGTARFDEVGQSRVLEAVRERLESHDCVALKARAQHLGFPGNSLNSAIWGTC